MKIYCCMFGQVYMFHRLLHLVVQIFSTWPSMPCVVELLPNIPLQATKASLRLENNATYITCQTEGGDN